MYNRHFLAIGLLSVFYACKTTQQSQVAQTTTSSAIGATASKKYPGPPQSEKFNHSYNWNDYCSGSATDASAQIIPNYENQLVDAASKKLSQVWSHSFALYSQVLAKYPETRNTAAPTGVSKDAHTFLIYLCGEFRDRPSMINAKLNWVASMNYLPLQKSETFDVSKDPWSQMTAHDYLPFKALSDRLFYRRFNSNKTKIGNNSVDLPTPAMTTCDVKFLMAEYIRKNKNDINITEYNQNFEQFKTQCSQEDLDYYVDFRGDPNIKPNSPESNGMIWYGISTMMQCKNRNLANQQGSKVKVKQVEHTQNIRLNDQFCNNYFLKPFETRWLGARAGLGTWLLRHPKHDSDANRATVQLNVLPTFDPEFDVKPFAFKIRNVDGEFVNQWQDYWHEANFGIDKLYNKEQYQQILFERLRDGVDRHTNWYASGYIDGVNQGRDNTQAYSPFVASSYEISKSDGFVACGPTIPCFGDDRSWKDSRNYKHFMYVFKVHKSRWFTPERVLAGETPNFDLDWIDETTFGTEQLAKHERAWDRLGTPLEHELETILYLHNICQIDKRVATQVDSNGQGICGPGFGENPSTEPASTDPSGVSVTSTTLFKKWQTSIKLNGMPLATAVSKLKEIFNIDGVTLGDAQKWDVVENMGIGTGLTTSIALSATQFSNFIKAAGFEIVFVEGVQ